jgi:hypothetical protein
MAHKITLELRLTVSRKGMGEVSEQLLDNEVHRMIAEIGEMFTVDSLDYKYDTKRIDD